MARRVLLRRGMKRFLDRWVKNGILATALAAFVVVSPTLALAATPAPNPVPGQHAQNVAAATAIAQARAHGERLSVVGGVVFLVGSTGCLAGMMVASAGVLTVALAVGAVASLVGGTTLASIGNHVVAQAELALRAFRAKVGDAEADRAILEARAGANIARSADTAGAVPAAAAPATANAGMHH